jgi:hypothetical protein
MAYPNIFKPATTQALIDRINQLTPTTQPQWGKMQVGQMLAHCCVAYEMALEGNHPRPNVLMRMLLTAFVKSTVVGEKPYQRNSRTAPAFLITDERDFETEKKRIIGYLKQTQQMGEAAFEQRASHSFGKLSSQEWSVMFYKHLDHHLQQFGL